jgi:hypothetical protein
MLRESAQQASPSPLPGSHTHLLADTYEVKRTTLRFSDNLPHSRQFFISGNSECFRDTSRNLIQPATDLTRV